MTRILVIEAVQYGSYYAERYELLVQLGYEIQVLYGCANGPAQFSGSITAGTTDVATIADKAAVLHGETPFDGVTTLAEPSVLATAFIADRLSLPYLSRSAALRSRNKACMRRAHAAAGAPHPDFIFASDISDLAGWESTGHNYPAIIKPTMGAASSFVFKVCNRAGLERFGALALDHLSEVPAIQLEATGLDLGPHGIIVEEFLTGSEHLIEGYVHAGRFVMGSLVDRIAVEGSTFDNDVHHAPTVLPADKVAAVHDAVQLGTAAQGIDGTTVHAEVRFHGGRPFIVEIGARPGGGGLHHMAQASYGYDALRATAEIAIGRDPEHRFAPAARHTVAACLISEAEGEIVGVNGADGIDDADVLFTRIVARPGDINRRPPNGNSILGFLGVLGDDFEQTKAALSHASARITVNVKGGTVR